MGDGNVFPSEQPVCKVFRVEATGNVDKENVACAHEMQWIEKTVRLEWVKLMGRD